MAGKACLAAPSPDKVHGLFWGHGVVLYEVAEGYEHASGSTGFAVDVDRSLVSDVPVDELDTSRNQVERDDVEIGGRELEM